MKHISRILWGAVLALTGLCPSVASAQDAVTLPFSSDFSTDTPWTLVNDEGKNVWVIGEDANTNADGKGLFTSLDGSQFAYNWPTTSSVEKATSVSHAYVKVNVAANQKLLLSFRYFVGGDSDAHGDYVEAGLYVGLLDASPTSGTIEAAEKYATPYANSVIWKNDPALWKEAVVAFDAPAEASEKYLVFTWYNDYNSNRYNVFAAIDDVTLLLDDCPVPSALTVGEVTASSIAYSWTAGEGIADLSDYTYQIQKKAGTGAWEDVTPVPAKDATAYTLSGLDENTAYGFRIRGYRSESSYSPWVTAPVTTTPYACPAPTDLAVEANADGDYVFRWTAEADARYILEYKLKTATEWNATAELTAGTYTLEAADLTPATAYEARVHRVCAEGAINYTEVVAFTTPCGVETLPYTEDFETWQADNSLSCWTLLDKDGAAKNWYVKYPFASYDDRTEACIKFNNNTKVGDRVISPALKIEAVSELSFWVKTGGYSSNQVPYAILISEDGTAPEKFVALPTPVLMEKTPWTKQKILIGESYIGKTVYIAIEGQSTTDFYIDDFAVKPYPAPSIAVAPTTNSATLTLSPSASTYSVRYRMAGTETWTTWDNQASPLTLPNLISGTAYEVQAQAHYAGGHDSEWSDLMTFNTCVELPYIQDFSTVEAGQIPTGWNQTSGTDWKVVETDGRKSLQLSSKSAVVISPNISLAGADFERLELLFTYKQKAYSSYVTVSISTDGATWTALEKLTAANSNPTDTDVALNLKDLIDANATFLMVRLEGTYSYSSFTFDLYDIRIQEHPRCLPPADMAVVAGTSTADLSWAAPAEMVPTAYQLRYGETEIDWEAETQPEELGADVLAKQLENLKANHTLYYVGMRSVCGEEGTSEPVTLLFHTLYTCPKIDDLHLTKLTDVSANLAFTYATEGVTYEAAYKTAAAADWTPAPVSAATSFELTALQPDTRYLARVRVVCAADDQSLWDTVAFKTPAGIQALPLKEGFEGTFTENAPEGWQYECLSGAAATPQVEQVKGEQVFRYAGEAALRHPGNTGGASLLVSPYLALQADQYYRLSFALRLEGYETAKTDSLGIWFNTAPTLTGARKIAVLKNNGDTDDYKADLVDGALGRWKPMLFDSLTDLESGYLLLHIQGDANQSNPFYIDELSLARIYATNLELQAVAPMPARANMGAETVAVVLNNTGAQAFVGEVQLSYQVNERPAVSETLTFTAENPLASQTPYTYTFAAKADLSAKGTYTVKATLASDEDPLPDDNAAELTTESYAALALPFETDFSPESAGAAYIHTLNADQDDYEWILPPAQPQAMIYGRNSGHLDDYLYTPGLNLPAGKYEVRITYAARQATYLERLSVGAYTDFTDKEAALPILTDTTSATAQKTAEGLLEIAEDGIYMLGIHAESDSSRGINVYSLSIKAKEEPVVKPLINIALFDTICDGETYRFGERELTEAGRYFDTIRAAEADTARELTLTVLLKPVPPVISRQDEGKTVTLVAETPEAQVQWYEADEMIFGAEEKRFTVTYDGVYHATAIGVCGESEPSNKLEVKMPMANEGLEDAAALTLYPNPSADGRFMLAVSPAYEGATLYVYGLDGRLRQRQTLHAGEQEIRLQAAETGVYMFRFVTADGRTYSLKATVR